MTGSAQGDLFGDSFEPASAVLSPDLRYRYVLHRQWLPGERTMTFVMLNPSIADASVDDPTVRRCRGFAQREGCVALRVVNLYALRSTDPDRLWIADDPVGPDNDDWLRSAGALPGLHVAAWGVHAKPDRVERAVELLTASGNTLHALSTTKDGSPGHPLYLRGDAFLVRWPS